MSFPPADNLANGPVARSYWAESRQPIYSAALILPFALAYEAGIFLMHSNLINGGDAIMRTLFGRLFTLMSIQFGCVSVLVLVVLFVGAQIYRKGSWSVQPPVLLAALFESLLYAAILFSLLHYLVDYLPHANERGMPAQAAQVAAGGASRQESASDDQP